MLFILVRLTECVFVNKTAGKLNFIRSGYRISERRHLLCLCITSTCEVTDKNKKPHVLRLGLISASALFIRVKVVG